MTKRISKPQDIRRLLASELNTLQADNTLDPIQRARAIGYLSSVSLTAMKDGDLEARIAALEESLKRGNGK